MSFSQSRKLRLLALSIFVVSALGGLNRSLDAQTCTTQNQSAFEWQGRWWQWSYTDMGGSGVGNVCIDGNGYLRLKVTSGSADIFVASFDAVDPGYGYYTEVSNLSAGWTSLVSPIWLARYEYPFNPNGESDIEFFGVGSDMYVRYIVQPWEANVREDSLFPESYAWSRQLNIIEWYGGYTFGSSSNRVRFVTDILDPYRFRANDYDYTGSYAPGLASENMHLNISLRKTANYVNTSDELIVRSWGMYAL